MALVSGCFIDTVPARGALDEAWHEWMLVGHYGAWLNGKEMPSSTPAKNEIAAFPGGATLTKYGIDMRADGGAFQGDWWVYGGLIGLAQAPGAKVEFFVKQNVRGHWPGRTAKFGRDYSQEYFLIVRPQVSGRGRIIKHWDFGPSSLALVIDPRTEERYRRNYSEREAQKYIEQNKLIMTTGRLHFDRLSRTATVTITGLTRPFEERIDLSSELGQSDGGR